MLYPAFTILIIVKEAQISVLHESAWSMMNEYMSQLWRCINNKSLKFKENIEWEIKWTLKYK